LEEKCTYFRIFGATGAPHLFPAYIPEILALGEIFYQTILQGFNASLVKDKKRVFIPYGFQLGYYFVKDTTQAKQEGLSHLEYMFRTSRYRKHDLKGLLVKHVEQVMVYWPYAHDKFEDEVFTENAHSWDEVIQRKSSLTLLPLKLYLWMNR
jgi:hypothetical protein